MKTECHFSDVLIFSDHSPVERIFKNLIIEDMAPFPLFSACCPVPSHEANIVGQTSLYCGKEMNQTNSTMQVNTPQIPLDKQRTNFVEYTSAIGVLTLGRTN